MSERRLFFQFVVGLAGACLILTGCNQHLPIRDRQERELGLAEPKATAKEQGVVRGISEGHPPSGQVLGGTPAHGPYAPSRPLAATTLAGHQPQPVQGPIPTAVHHGPVAHGAGYGPEPPGPPNELNRVSLPPYVIAPPDVLLINPIRLQPKRCNVIEEEDILHIRAAEPLPNRPIDGKFTVGLDGTISLGYGYGRVRVAGLTLEQAERAIRQQLAKELKTPAIAVGWEQKPPRPIQQVRGEHLVRQDGTVDLGSYGCVYVAGLTLAQAKVAIERHLSQYLPDPEVAVDVLAYNSKIYYVITDGAGFGMQVYRFPITGNETVLDAISNIGGLPAVSSSRHIWVARPAPSHHDCLQILPVDWIAITEGAATRTNYQLFPGDRVYIKADHWINWDNRLAKFFAPIERILGFMLLASSTANNFRSNNGGGGNAPAFIAPLR